MELNKTQLQIFVEEGLLIDRLKKLHYFFETADVRHFGENTPTNTMGYSVYLRPNKRSYIIGGVAK